MSRYYQMAVEVQGYDPDAVDEIIAILRENWNYESVTDYIDEELGTVLNMSGDDYLYADMDEESYAEHTAKDVWEANGGYCFVTVIATYLEDLPSEKYTFDNRDYEQLTANAKSDES
jgi:hypothetical protein